MWASGSHAGKGGRQPNTLQPIRQGHGGQKAQTARDLSANRFPGPQDNHFAANRNHRDLTRTQPHALLLLQIADQQPETVQPGSDEQDVGG